MRCSYLYQKGVYQELPYKSTEFYPKIKKSKEKCRAKINQLAKRLGVSEDTVINREVRRLTPRRWKLERIEAVLAKLTPFRI